eukprot:scaffold539_cov187-Ochromonas_danica.AAC.6
MGKAKPTKKHRPLDSTGGGSYNTTTPSTTTTTTSTSHSGHSSATNMVIDNLALNELESNLGSLDHLQRQAACRLLSDLYQFNITQHGSLEALASKKILMKLGMRLIDHCIPVQLAASQALKTLSDCHDIKLCHRLISVGIFRTAITLVMTDGGGAGGGGAGGGGGVDDVRQNLLYSIANILTTLPEAGEEIGQHYRDFLPFLFSLLQGSLHGVVVAEKKQEEEQEEVSPLRVVNTVGNVLIVALKTRCVELVREEDYLLVSNLVNQFLLAGQVTIVRGGDGGGGGGGGEVLVSIPSLQEKDYDHWVVLLQLLEILLCLHSRGRASSSSSSTTSLGMMEVVKVLLAVLQRVLADPQLLQAPQPRTTSTPTVTTSAVVDEGMETEETVLDKEQQQQEEEESQWQLSLAETILEMLTGTAIFLTEQATLYAEAGGGGGGGSQQQGVVVSAASLQQSAIVFHEGKVTANMMETILHLRTVFNYHLTSTSPTPSEGAGGGAAAGGGGGGSNSGSPVQYVVDRLGCQVLVTLEKTTTTAIESSRLDLLHCQLSTTTAAATGTGTVTVTVAAIRHHYMQGYLRGLMEHLTWLHGAVEAIASTVIMLDDHNESQSQKKKKIISSSWITSLEEEEGVGGAGGGAGGGGGGSTTLKVSIVNNAVLCWELLHVLLEIVTLSNLHEHDEVKELVTLVLRWLQCPYLEIIVSVVTCVSYLATSSSSSSSTTTTTTTGSSNSSEGSVAGGGSGRLPVSYHSLLSNALINRAMQPSAFSFDTSTSSTSSTSSSSQGSRNDNVHRSSILVMDVCVNALIDLHASDDMDYLTAFAKMGLGGKLLSIQMQLNQSYMNSTTGGSSGSSSKKKKVLSLEDEEKVEETLQNLTNFLSYKHSCLNGNNNS